jgi:predicted MPP superfamily phosphohydrolase
MDGDIVGQLERRLGRVHARQRLGIEADFEAHVFGHGINFFHIENWYSIHGVIRTGLWLAGLYGRGKRNAAHVVLRENYVRFADLPEAFDGFTILHLSDLHVDMSRPAMDRVAAMVADLAYDACVLTGDYRARTFGSHAAALHGMERLMPHLRQPVYGVLGNHDTVRMIPSLEAMGIRMLLNESEAITRDGQTLHIAGVDDAHYYRVDNIEKAAAEFSHDAFSILLSHTPEIYRQAAHAGFRLMLSGHTHGGQICLPGGVPITLDSILPRSLGAGAWEYQGMAGYTSVGAGSSVVAVRLNCQPEVTLHHLNRG